MPHLPLFTNRVAVLATMHQKELVMAPILEELGLKVIVPANFNTDTFGTFTREVKRPGTQIEAARIKAQKVLEITGETIAVASEGSFAPHPSLPYISSNREIVLLIDKENDLISEISQNLPKIFEKYSEIIEPIKKFNDQRNCIKVILDLLLDIYQTVSSVKYKSSYDRSAKFSTASLIKQFDKQIFDTLPKHKLSRNNISSPNNL